MDQIIIVMPVELKCEVIIFLLLRGLNIIILIFVIIKTGYNVIQNIIP